MIRSPIPALPTILALALTGLMLTGCKASGSGDAQAAHIPGPFTHLREHATPAFQEVAVLARNTQFQALNAFGSGQMKAQVWTPCSDPAVSAALNSQRNQLMSCAVKVLDPQHALVAAKISNGWLILADGQSTRNVTEAEFAQAQQQAGSWGGHAGAVKGAKGQTVQERRPWLIFS